MLDTVLSPTEMYVVLCFTGLLFYMSLWPNTRA